MRDRCRRCAGIERREAEKRNGAERACSGRREADFCADGKHGKSEPPGASWGGLFATLGRDESGGRCARRTRVTIMPPSARKSQRVLPGLSVTRWKMSEPMATPGIPVASMTPRVRQIDLRAPDLHRHDDQLDGSGVGERGADAASATGTWRKRMSNGAVSVPAPTPVIAISAAIPKPSKNFHDDTSEAT